jgi:RNA polymerase sigma-70 factor (ECF subfamily)
MRARFDGVERDLTAYIEARIDEARLDGEEMDEEEIEDDRLRLIFTCCHPALPQEGQVALTLREVCGLTTEEIAHAFRYVSNAGPAHCARQGAYPR